ncbi:MAG: carbohydrate ABC transporter permease [Fusobacteriaceae bacterium]
MKKIKFDFLYTISVFLFLVFTLVPILWCFIISISPESTLFSDEVTYLPSVISLENYKKLLNPNLREGASFFNAISNSIKTASITIFLGIPISIFSGYAFSRLKFRGKELFEKLVLVTIIVPLFTTIIPLYTIFSDYEILDNTFWLSLIYVSSFLPVITWITSNYFNTFPEEIEEMALIEGCGNIEVFFYIILPNTYPIILTSILMIFLMSWNQYQIPLILASSRETKPLSILIAEFSSKDMIQYGQMAAAGILALLPPSILAIIFRKYLVGGLTKGATKG